MPRLRLVWVCNCNLSFLAMRGCWPSSKLDLRLRSPLETHHPNFAEVTAYATFHHNGTSLGGSASAFGISSSPSVILHHRISYCCPIQHAQRFRQRYGYTIVSDDAERLEEEFSSSRFELQATQTHEQETTAAVSFALQRQAVAQQKVHC